MKDILKEIKKLDKEKNYKEIENIFKSLNFDKPHVRNNRRSFYENKELHMLERNLRKLRKVINYRWNTMLYVSELSKKERDIISYYVELSLTYQGLMSKEVFDNAMDSKIVDLGDTIDLKVFNQIKHLDIESAFDYIEVTLEKFIDELYWIGETKNDKKRCMF